MKRTIPFAIALLFSFVLTLVPVAALEYSEFTHTCNSVQVPYVTVLANSNMYDPQDLSDVRRSNTADEALPVVGGNETHVLVKFRDAIYAVSRERLNVTVTDGIDHHCVDRFSVDENGTVYLDLNSYTEFLVGFGICRFEYLALLNTGWRVVYDANFVPVHVSDVGYQVPETERTDCVFHMLEDYAINPQTFVWGMGAPAWDTYPAMLGSSDDGESFRYMQKFFIGQNIRIGFIAPIVNDDLQLQMVPLPFHNDEWMMWNDDEADPYLYYTGETPVTAECGHGNWENLNRVVADMEITDGYIVFNCPSGDSYMWQVSMFEDDNGNEQPEVTEISLPDIQLDYIQDVLLESGTYGTHLYVYYGNGSRFQWDGESWTLYDELPEGVPFDEITSANVGHRVAWTRDGRTTRVAVIIGF